VGITSERFFEAVVHPSKEFVPAIETTVATLLPQLRGGDLVLCLGAGSVGAMPEKFLGALNEVPLPQAAVDEAVALVAGVGL